ncbi:MULTISPECIES: FAD-binding protein [Microbacterium]|uniref:FAD-binding protein n=1 Tax=Microbacterium TaxID=33882 RepID=UPI003BA020D1
MTEFLSPSDPRFDAECVGYNLSVAHRPDLVVPASTVEDVIDGVRFAAERGLGIAVQATGHGPSLPADGGVLIRTSGLDAVEIDPVRRIARVGAGVRGGDLVRAAAAHGLAPVNGSSPEVGVIGYHLGGGVGILGRTLGWAVDHVRALDVVTADGAVRRASATEEPELFWALRGAGRGTLGVVVGMEVALHPISRLYGGGMHFAAEDVERALRAWAEWTQTVPEAMGTSALLIRMPDLPQLPDALRGRSVLHLRFAFTGSAEEGARLVQPFRDLDPATDTVAEMPYAEVGSIHAEPTAPVPFHGRNTVLASLAPAAISTLLRHAGPEAAAPYLVELRLLGGALARPAAVPSAIGRRDGAFVLYAGGAAHGDDAPALRSALAGLIGDMSPWSTGGVLASFLSGPAVTRAELATAYLPEDTARVERIKRAVDPHDLFRAHHGRADG